MSYDLNQQDIELLKSNPHQLILNHQKLIENIIHLYIRSGKFSFEDINEVKQQVNEELLGKIFRIREQFQGKSLLRTYLSVIIRNICNEILRKKVKLHFVPLNENDICQMHLETIHNLIFEEEIIRLKKAIDLFYKQKWKLLLCLKLKFKMSFNIEDFQNVYNHITKAEFEKFISFVQPYADCNEMTLFFGLTHIFNRYERRENTPDSLRKWVTDKINELVAILNGDPPTSKYDRETFQILFEKSFYVDPKVMVNNIPSKV